MSWQQLQSDGKVRTHVTSAQELSDLRAVVERDLADAKIQTLSTDRRFATAYNAALQISKMVAACAGFRITGLGAHQTAFQAMRVEMGPSVDVLMNYFDACRRKRNHVDYDMAGVATETETAELLERTKEFRLLAEAWVAKNYPQYVPPPPPSV